VIHSTRATLMAFLAVTLTLPLLAANASTAGEPLSLGAHGHWGSAAGGGFGGRVNWGDRPALVVGLETFLAKEELGLRQSRRELRVDGILHLRPRASSLRPYIGAGMSFLRTASHMTAVPWDVSATRWGRGGNLLAGLELALRPRLRLHVEARGQLWGARQIVLSSGIGILLAQ
jgi:hypothetical protein